MLWKSRTSKIKIKSLRATSEKCGIPKQVIRKPWDNSFKVLREITVSVEFITQTTIQEEEKIFKYSNGAERFDYLQTLDEIWNLVRTE